MLYPLSYESGDWVTSWRNHRTVSFPPGITAVVARSATSAANRTVQSLRHAIAGGIRAGLQPVAAP